MKTSLRKFLSKAVVEVRNNWQDFLQAFSYICKNGGLNSILIYAQDRSVKMVASNEKWQEYGRAVKFGAKAIFKIKSMNPHKLEYVFKYSDTHGEEIGDVFNSKALLEIDDIEDIIHSYFEDKDIATPMVIESVKNVVYHRLYGIKCTQESPNLDSADLVSYINQVGIHSFRLYKIIRVRMSSEEEGEKSNDINLRNEKWNSVSTDRSRNNGNENTRQIRTDGHELSNGKSSGESGLLSGNEPTRECAIKSRKRSQSENGCPNEDRGNDDHRRDKRRHIEAGSKEKVNKSSSRRNGTERNCTRHQIDFFTEHENYTFSSEDDVSSFGPKAKFKANIKAIETLKMLNDAERFPTQEEQSHLAKYVGWGGLAAAFSKANRTWSKESEALKSLLSKEEYISARASTTSAYFTPHFVVEEILSYLGKCDQNNGRLIDPSMGTGHFFSHLKSHDYELHGVELDIISGEISKKLFPKAEIKVMGFEETSYPDNYFDVAIGNVPFGDYSVHDLKYSGYNFYIHDYFFAKGIDLVKPGGLILFITSKGTLDKRDSRIRKYISERSKLLGAVRLPSGTFSRLAGTEVTTDIIILQKRKAPQVSNDPWMQVSENSDGILVNEYFLDHPEMCLGKMAYDTKVYGKDSKYTVCLSEDSESLLKEKLSEALSLCLPIETIEYKEEEKVVLKDTLAADPQVEPYTFTVIQDTVYYRDDKVMRKINRGKDTLLRIRGLNDLRKITRRLIDEQLEGCSDERLKDLQVLLNDAYDRFTDKYGYISSKKNRTAFRDDNDYPLLTSLEIENKDKTVSKTSFFEKRTIKVRKEITSVSSAKDALLTSLDVKGEIDVPYMLSLYDIEENVLYEELKGQMFMDPHKFKASDMTKGWLLREAYLSGNVRDKLNIAKASAKENDLFKSNVEALKSVQPVDLKAGEIDFKLGTPWISESDYEAFIYDLLETPKYHRNTGHKDVKDEIRLKYNSYENSWFIENKSKNNRSVLATENYGTKRITAYDIIERTLNLQDVVIKDNIKEGDKDRYVVNQKETMLAREKQRLIKVAFKEWLFKDIGRRERYVKYYNEYFNNIVPRIYDGSHLTFPGMNPYITLSQHQKNAVARILYGGNALLAHCVGAGKTYEMMAAIMELKRLSLIDKAILVVPNHLTGQMGAEFLTLYPSANVLVTTKKDFEKERRRRFISRIATGSYDAVIIGFSQFEKITVSEERQIAMLNNQIQMVVQSIEKQNMSKGKDWSVKQMESYKKKLMVRLKKLTDSSKKDTILNFESLGVDALFLDEAHYYKNCAVFSKMKNVAGVSNVDAKKSSDMLMKVQYINEISNERGVVFATGTPISNSMSELFVMQRYLQPSALRERGLSHFDAWAAQFGEVISSIELSPEGGSYRIKNRFAKFINLPELIAMFREVADVQTAKMLDLPVPKLIGGKAQIVTAECSTYAKDIMASFAERAEAIRSGSVDPSEDNMLKITNEGRKLGVDPRLYDINAVVDKKTKLDMCIERVIKHYKETESFKGTQVIFSDIGTPGKDGRFSVYDFIKEKLIDEGIPSEEICFIHDAKTDIQRENMFSTLRNGTRRVIIGSTQKMGTGTNIQDRLVALHHIDCPFRPSDIEQREGRVLRQGNMNAYVAIYRYVTLESFDAYLWQMVENKQRFISQIMTDKIVDRSVEDIDEAVLSFAEVKAIATGNPLIKEKLEIDSDVTRLQLLKTTHDNKKYELENNFMRRYPEIIEASKKIIEICEGNIRMRKSDGFKIEIYGQILTDRTLAQKHLRQLFEEMPINKKDNCIIYRGFKISMYKDFNRIFIVHGVSDQSVKNKSYRYMLEDLDCFLESFEEKIANHKRKIGEMEQNIIASKTAFEEPFLHEKELKSKLIRQSELNTKLNYKKALA